MESSGANRVMRELREAMQWDRVERSLIKIEMVGDNWKEFRGQITGPKDSPYEGGKFWIEIKLQEGYSFVPPKVRFITSIWHPNVSPYNGTICRDNFLENWTASMTMRTVLLSLQGLLSAPEPDEPQEAIIGTQYETMPHIFEMTAQHWTYAYAGGPQKYAACDTKILHLRYLGVDVDEARLTLSKVNWDLESAKDRLFNYLL